MIKLPKAISEMTRCAFAMHEGLWAEMHAILSEPSCSKKTRGDRWGPLGLREIREATRHSRETASTSLVVQRGFVLRRIQQPCGLGCRMPLSKRI
jgi:hypothetical protein